MTNKEHKIKAHNKVMKCNVCKSRMRRISYSQTYEDWRDGSYAVNIGYYCVNCEKFYYTKETFEFNKVFELEEIESKIAECKKELNEAKQRKAIFENKEID